MVGLIQFVGSLSLTLSPIRPGTSPERRISARYHSGLGLVSTGLLLSTVMHACRQFKRKNEEKMRKDDLGA